MDEPEEPTPEEAAPKGRLTFRREKRLVRESDFARAYRQGNRAKGQLMTVAVVPNSTGVTRLGLSIGKRVWKKAVPRNRVRRIFREAFRLSFPDLPVGVDIVMIGSVSRVDPALSATRVELVRLSKKALRRYEEKLAERAAAGPPEEGAAE